MASVAPSLDSAPRPAVHHAPAKSLLAATWQVLDQVSLRAPLRASVPLLTRAAQPPPPSLREILGAYRSRGDGDREMLMAMLNAKSAEDQRIASVASLHRSMLEYYQVPQHAAPQYDPPYPPQLASPAPYDAGGSSSSSTHRAHYDAPHPHASSSSAPTPHRKRPRASASPPLPYAYPPRHAHAHAHARARVPSSSPPQHVPSSPYSSARSDSADRSPRARDAMAIGSLLTPPRHDAPTTSAEQAQQRNGSTAHGHGRRASNPMVV
ncbi:hypothetical protein FA95DRAFT_1555410 [Auriscalpium vulgare]|uniref:Uncharacterized protein n=1 Tax=Auriscalpium vulgare TaxID=40419 RepID=A0ACB8S3M2_9AGAM|nr:hypothetical protein FA95DRAFT_1555410 [Auriscalpium vulgare]